MKNPLIGLSIIPALPIVLFSAGFVFSGKGPKGEMWFLLCAATFLGLCGLYGLIMASIRKTYFHTKLKLRAIFLIACGYIAVALGVYSVFVSQNQRPPGNLDRLVSEPFPTIQLTIILLLLAWPLLAGIVGVIDLSKKNA